MYSSFNLRADSHRQASVCRSCQTLANAYHAIPMLENWYLPFGLLALGLVIAWFGFLLLDEYRKAFFANPKVVMSFEVFS